MTCETTKNSGINARFGICSSGANSEAPSGPRNGLKAQRSHAGELPLIDFSQMPPVSGSSATAARPTTGAERCTGCMEGQGDDCYCRDAKPPRDYAGMRMVAGWLALFWLAVAVAYMRWWA